MRLHFKNMKPIIKEFIIEVMDFRVTGKDWWYIDGDDGKTYKFHAIKGQPQPKLGQMLKIWMSSTNKSREISKLELYKDDLVSSLERTEFDEQI